MLDIKFIKHWKSLASQLKEVKAQELEYRKEIAYEILGKDETGTKHEAFGDIEVSCSATMKLTADRDKVLALMDNLTDAEKECITWKPSIDKKLYDKLPKRAKLRKAVTAKVGCPSVSATSSNL